MPSTVHGNQSYRRCACVWACAQKIGTIINLKKNEDRVKLTAHCVPTISQKQRITTAKIVHLFIVHSSALLQQHIVAVVVSLILWFFPSTSPSLYTVFLHDEYVGKCICEKLITTDLEVENKVNEIHGCDVVWLWWRETITTTTWRLWVTIVQFIVCERQHSHMCIIICR